ncbi:MAG TPA: hypothetical protein VGE21_06800, partial [Flavobacteriales bacterium]
MMRFFLHFRSLLVLVASGVVHAADAQTPAPGKELVVNGGFEQVRKTPHTFDQLKECQGWSNVTIGYSEVFDAGAPAKTVGIPKNEYGEMPAAEGERYGGFFAWKDDLRRDWSADEDPFMPGWSAYSEYLMTELAEPLVEGVTYEVTYQLALAQNSDRTVSGVGVYASPVPLKYEHRRFLQERPQVGLDKWIEERGKWVAVTQQFVADGGERYLIVGTFPMLGFDHKRIVEGPDNQYAYYYIDAV